MSLEIFNNICDALSSNSGLIAAAIFGDEAVERYVYPEGIEYSSGVTPEFGKFLFAESKNPIEIDYFGEEIVYVNLSDINDFLEQTEQFNKFKLEEVEMFGGEGQGDTCWVVVKLVAKLEAEEDITLAFFKCNGFHSSYEGSAFEDAFIEVEPVPVTKFVYTPKS